MRILMTGGTGLIGRRLCAALTARGDRVTVLSRRPQQVAALCGASVKSIQSLDEYTPNIEFDAVINLAGEPIVDARWTAQRKQMLLDSRVALTTTLVQKIKLATHQPQVLLSGSAIGYYGMHEEQSLTEDDASGHDFSAQLCAAWEQAALVAQDTGVRVVLLRTGLVMDEKGGLLKKMLLPFRMALGSRLGNGRQWMSWIHRQDYLRAVLTLLDDQTAKGAFNLTAPQPVTNAQFTQTLASTVHRPAVFFAPATMLKLVLGERSDLLLSGQKVVPQALSERGFKFEFADLTSALRDLLK
ncbi:TIGR01777 family oxidoreductase [Undibacterium sp. Di24W]|uniref:TIGR01777 family oxidoreductase n=1 Tax=Undibacterium sp. Di24W TaxID=3413033 RepID=UPI003BF260FC